MKSMDTVVVGVEFKIGHGEILYKLRLIVVDILNLTVLILNLSSIFRAIFVLLIVILLTKESPLLHSS